MRRRAAKTWHIAIRAGVVALVMTGLMMAAGCATSQPVGQVDNLRRAYRGTIHQYQAYLTDAGLADAHGYHASADYLRTLAKRELARAHEEARLMRQIQGES